MLNPNPCLANLFYTDILDVTYYVKYLKVKDFFLKVSNLHLGSELMKYSYRVKGFLGPEDTVCYSFNKSTFFKVTCHTRLVCSLQGIFILVETTHNGFPTRTYVFKFFALMRQLLPDVLSLENVLGE